MKYLLLLIISLCANCFTCFAQQSLSNPLYLGPILIDKPNVEAMAKVCEQYKLTEIPSDDDCKAYRYMDGTLIKFNIVPDPQGNKQPYVEIHTKESKKNIEKTILNAGFRKENNRYEKGYHGANRFSVCKITGNNKLVIFTKESSIKRF